jgi:ubiquinone/menaquinone biosynthesis C-methylase UbiE
MASPNKAEFDRWNADDQVRGWPKREQVTICVTPALLEALALKPGERVLDIGAGGGLAAMEAARAVGEGGSVTGFDISVGLTKLANARAAEASSKNVRFVAGDAQVDDIPGAPFDVAMSQFGVMFFADPVQAFENIRRHMAPGGRMVFACWQPYTKNTWFPGPKLEPFLTPPPAGSAPAPQPGSGPPPGPFAFGDPALVRSIVEKAGFKDVSVEQIEREAVVERDSLFDREMLNGFPIAPEKKEDAWAALQAHIESMVQADGKMHLALAPQLVRAHNSA